MTTHNLRSLQIAALCKMLLVGIMFTVGSVTTFAQQLPCTATITVSGFGFTGNCSSFGAAAVWNVPGSTTQCSTIIFTSNGSADYAICCDLSATSLLGITIFGDLVYPGETRRFANGCGCVEVTVGTPNGISGTISISITRIGSTPCP